VSRSPLGLILATSVPDRQARISIVHYTLSKARQKRRDLPAKKGTTAARGVPHAPRRWQLRRCDAADRHELRTREKVESF
jgi:hypothetical protein